MDRITAIRRSLAAFVWGIIGVLPVIGLIPAVCALGHWWAVQSKYRDQWNPASTYLRLGGALALFGLLSTVLLVAVVVIEIADVF
jgi:hypothetical protein